MSAVTGFAGTALMLAAVAIYGLISFLVSQSRREIGVRMALGARPRDVMGTFLLRASRWTAAGIGVGVAASLMIGEMMSAAVFGISVADPTTCGVVIVLLVLVSEAACWLPVPRACRVDPVRVLNAD